MVITGMVYYDYTHMMQAAGEISPKKILKYLVNSLHGESSESMGDDGRIATWPGSSIKNWGRNWGYKEYVTNV